MAEGRPKIEIDKSQLRKLCEILCSLQEIAYYFNCSEATIERRVKAYYNITFADFSKQCIVGTKLAIKRQIFKMAMQGNTAMVNKIADNLKIMTEPIGTGDADLGELEEVYIERIKADMTPAKAGLIYKDLIRKSKGE